MLGPILLHRYLCDSIDDAHSIRAHGIHAHHRYRRVIDQHIDVFLNIFFMNNGYLHLKVRFSCILYTFRVASCVLLSSCLTFVLTVTHLFLNK